tara:strand:+ start:2863 stop:3996 length:1134 start_codon:yes stop_codon:yes gene_type:complete
MSIYRIFPDKDSIIYSEQNTSNAGLDEIVEVAGYTGVNDGTGEASRTILKFRDSDIDTVINSKIGASAINSMSASIKMYLAEAGEVPVDYTLYAYPVYIAGSGDWDNGNGKQGDTPVNTTGVSWLYKNAGQLNAWSTSGFTQYTTGSFIAGKGGGGNWYTASNGEDMEFAQTHSISSTHDLDINVTPAIKQIYQNTLPNKGFIVKLENQFEFYTTASIRIKYFSRDTNTIYPPFLEFAWDDRTYNHGSLPVLATDIATIDVKNNKGRYPDVGKQRFRLTAKPTYPARAFTTSSVYLTNYALPSASYWGLRDENTEEMVVPFSTDFTKISCDPTGPFFDVYMDGLQPERYYRILVKTELDSSTVVINNDNVFKIVRNG